MAIAHAVDYCHQKSSWSDELKLSDAKSSLPRSAQIETNNSFSESSLSFGTHTEYLKSFSYAGYRSILFTQLDNHCLAIIWFWLRNSPLTSASLLVSDYLTAAIQLLSHWFGSSAARPLECIGICSAETGTYPTVSSSCRPGVGSIGRWRGSVGPAGSCTRRSSSVSAARWWCSRQTGHCRRRRSTRQTNISSI